ncbi:MAG: chemotaxis protein CheD [Firmicutes bacterium]|nr:chemotaxis protein CheD [Bacillota bacterium]
MAVLQVGMADLKVAKVPDILSSAGLGSCIGICLWDPITRIGGLAHIMLPSSALARNTDNKAKFADTAIPALVQEMERIGAMKSRLVAKIAGGAQMFALTEASSIMKIGERNAESSLETLRKMGIKLLHAETGANYGRSITFKTETGQLHIRTIEYGERIV